MHSRLALIIYFAPFVASMSTMPRVGLGSAESPPFESMAAAVHAAVDAGVGLIDTAQNYGSEKAVGEGLRRSRAGGKPREAAFVLAKVDLCSLASEDPRARMRRQVGSTLTNLDVEFLDAVAFHWPLCLDRHVNEEEARRVRKEAYQELELMVDKGLIRSLGLSNFNVQQMDEVIELARHRPVLNEIEFSPVCYQADLLKACEERGLRVVAYSPYGTCWIAKYFGNLVPWGAASLLEGDGVVGEIAEQSGLTPAQVLLTWCMQKGATPIPKSLMPERVKQTAKCLGDVRLDDEQMVILDGLNDSRRGVVASIEAHSRIIADSKYTWEKT